MHNKLTHSQSTGITNISTGGRSASPFANSTWAVRLALLIITLFVLASVVAIEDVTQALVVFRRYTMHQFGFFETILVNSTLVICLILAITRAGDLKLGTAADKPEFSLLSWFSMLFGSGLGVGFVFWSVAEPVFHAHSNPFTDNGLVGDAIGDPAFAVALSMYHWGFYVQSVYALIAIALGLACYRNGQVLRLRSVLRPLLGRHADGPLGFFAETVTLIATVLGLAISIGLGGQSLSAVVSRAVGGNWLIVMAIIISVIGALSFVCVTARINRFVRWLSLAASASLIILAISVLSAGPTGFQLNLMVEAGWRYLTLIPEISFWRPESSDANWQNNWSLAYWGWWIAWAPFVGTFYVRISRGRTLREFIAAVFIVPTSMTLVWICIFGGGALGLDIAARDTLTQFVLEEPAVGLFALLASLNFTSDVEGLIWLASITMIILLSTQSLNAGILGMRLLMCGKTNISRVEAFGWVCGICCIAIVLVLMGGTTMLQTSAIAGGLLFLVVYLAIIISLGIIVIDALYLEPWRWRWRSRNAVSSIVKH